MRAHARTLVSIIPKVILVGCIAPSLEPGGIRRGEVGASQAALLDATDATITGYADGSREVLAVLRVANEATADELARRTSLHPLAISHLIDHRRGSDQTLGTADDPA